MPPLFFYVIIFHNKTNLTQNKKMKTKTLTQLSQKEHDKIVKILEGQEKITYKEHYHLYIVPPQVMEKLVKMQKNFAKLLKEQNINPPRKKPYYYVAKLINPEPKDVAVDYSIVEIKRYILVKDKESILRNIDREFEVWKNRELKIAKEACQGHSEEFCKEIMDRTLNKIVHGEREKEKIKEHIHELDVLWTTYKIAKHYPSVAYKRVGQNHYNEHLRKHIPNILAYDPSLNRSRKRDNEVEAFLEEAKNAFGFFYYKE